MPLTITEVTIGSETDRRLTMQNAHWASTLDIGTDWTKLRVGCRVAWDDFGYNLPGSPRFYLGVMASPNSGLANGPLGPDTSHFLGFRSNTATWIRSAANYWRHAGNLSICKKVDATETTATASSSLIYASIQETQNRNAFLVEIEKFSPTQAKVETVFCSASTADTGDLTKLQLITAMEQTTMAAADALLDLMTGCAYTGSGGVATIAADESADGYWNAICVAWDRSTPICYVSDMFFAKME